jgi:hypothetical protein
MTTARCQYIDNIPAILKALPQWVGFNVVNENKTPYIADTPKRKASSTDPTTWRPFDIAAAGLKHGTFDAIAYTLNDDFIGVDLDDSLENGKPNSFAADVIRRCASYSEISHSGNGVHILMAGKLPCPGIKRDEIEIYSRARFFICTGNRITGTPTDIESNPEAVNWLLSEYSNQQSETELQKQFSASLLLCNSATPLLCYSVSQAIKETLPKTSGSRNKAIFRFARALKFECGMAGKTLNELRPLVKQWHEQALPFITTKPFADTWFDFKNGWEKARCPLSGSPVKEALARAIAEPPPMPELGFDDDASIRIYGLVYWLAKLNQGNFFLSCHDIMKIMGIDHVTAWRRLKLFTAEGLIEIVSVGIPNVKATRYRWTGGML